MSLEQQIVAPMITMARPKRSLDIGTGTGRNVALLADAGARLIVGLDLSLAMLERSAFGAPRVRADACRLPFSSDEFDFVCSSLMAGDVEDPGAWLQEVGRVLTPAGHLVYSDFHPSWADRRLRRTFRTADRRRFELSYFPHSVDQHLSGLERAGMAVKTIREPRLAGLANPVLVVFHAVKRARRSHSTPPVHGVCGMDSLR